MNADLGTQALDEGQIALGVLHAIFTLRVVTAETKLEGIAQDRVILEDPRNDLRHRLMLENSLVGAVTEVRQTRYQAEVIARQTFPGVALTDLINLTMDTGTVRPQTQKRLTVQQAFEVQIRSLTDQFQLEAKGLADGFLARELKDLEVKLGAFEGQRETRLIGRREHPMCLCRMRAGDSA